MAPIPKDLPVRWFLVAFAAVLLGPVLGLAVVALSQSATSERTRYVNEGREAAQQIAADVDRELSRVQTAAQALATSPLIASGNYEAFHRQASEFLRTWAPDDPASYAVILRDLNGQQLMNTGQTWGTPLMKVERDVDRLVVTNKQPQVQDLFFSASAGHLAVTVRVPVLKDGEVTYVLSIRLEPKRIAQLLQAQELPAQWNMAVIDNNDRVVARWPHHERFIGAQATEDFRRNAVGNEGTWVGTNLEGIRVLAAYARSELSGWRIVVGTPVSFLQAPDWRWRWTVSILSTVALALLIGLTFWFGRQIARPIHALEASAEQLAKGQSLSPVTTGLREINSVGRALALASKDLREREQALALVGLLPFRDVLHDANGIEAPGRVMHSRARHPDPPDRAVGPDVLLLDRVDRELTFHLSAEQPPVSVAIIRMGHFGEMSANEFVTRIALDLAVSFVGVENASISVELDDAHGRVVVGGPQAPLALPQGLLGLHALGHVRIRAEPAEHLALIILERLNAGEEWAEASVRRAEREYHLEGLAGFDRTRPAFHHGR